MNLLGKLMALAWFGLALAAGLGVVGPAAIVGGVTFAVVAVAVVLVVGLVVAWTGSRE